jgi:glycosyltransferase involved in cell wall biosynthesis
MYKRLIDHEYVVLARRLSRNKDVSVWFVPHPAWAQSGRIAAPLVVSVPDIVYADFPSVFAPEVFEPAMRRIRQLVGRAKMVISYSEYVRERHVVKYLGAPPERTTVIRHAAMPVSRHLSQIVKQWGGNSRMAARSLIQDFLDSRDNPLICPPSREYRRRFPFDEIPYLFVSSQVRAHKNYLNLFRAFEHLLRRKYLNLKLVMTGCLHDDAGLRQYVISNGLELDILSIPNMPNDVHAAFYHLAALTVTPPLFEGGLPFPFTESLSVGTPIVMSSIPVTREAIPPDLAEVMLFDPYDVDDIASRIAWAVQHRDELIAMQMPLYEGLCRRSWSDVAQEYLSVFRRAAGVAAPALTNSRPHA